MALCRIVSIHLLIIGGLLRLANSSSLYDWLGWSDNKGHNLTYKGVPLLDVPFEELSSEDKFLVEASKIAGFELTELDACQHRIVMKLKSSCGSLSEEDLAKFSVNLLNCQAAVEGRKEYPCQQEMSLKDCTEKMDAETWNAYHIMNNRARAVCYASRQQQFRALAEITVNKLVSTTHTHLEALSALQAESAKLKGGTSLTLEQIEKSQRDVLARQRSLASLSLVLGRELERSLTAASDHKAMLVTYKKDLAGLFSKLQNKLDDAGKQMGESMGSVKTSHEDLMKDLKEISSVANQIITEIDKSSKEVLDNNNIVLKQFEDVLVNVKEINLSIGSILSVVDTIKQRSSVISDIVGEKGENIEVLLLASLHCACLISAMVVTSFLSAPWSSRLVLLISSCLNAYASLANINQPELGLPKIDLIHFYLGFTVVAITDWVIRLIVSAMMKRKTVESPAQFEHVNNHLDRHRSSRDIVDSTSKRVVDDSPLSFLNNRGLRETPVSSKVNNWLSDNQYETSSRLKSNLNGYFKDPNDMERHSRASSMARSQISNSVDARSTCTAVSKRTGQRCRKKALKSSSFCSVHDR